MSVGQTGHFHGTKGTRPRDGCDPTVEVSRQISLLLLFVFSSQFDCCLSGAPLLDIQSCYRHSYSQSPYFSSIARYRALYPLIQGKTNQNRGAIGVQGGYRSSSSPREAISLWEANRSYSITNRGYMSH